MEKSECKDLSKQCTLCGKVKTFANKRSYKLSKRDNYVCQPCANKVKGENLVYNKREQNPAWKGYMEIPYGWFSSYFERGAGSKRRVGNITIQQVHNLWIKQNKKCALSGVEIGFYDEGTKHTCSIDRIDSLKEYTLDNIQLVHKHINTMKNVFKQNYFIEMCKLIAENNKK